MRLFTVACKAREVKAILTLLRQISKAKFI